MLGNTASVTRWKNPRVDGGALPGWSSDVAVWSKGCDWRKWPLLRQGALLSSLQLQETKAASTSKSSVPPLQSWQSPAFQTPPLLQDGLFMAREPCWNPPAAQSQLELILSEPGSSNTDTWTLEEGLACPLNIAWLHIPVDIHNPTNTLTGSFLIQACTTPNWHHPWGVAGATGCPLWSLAAAPLLPAVEGPSPAGCATEPTRDKCHVFPQEQLEETNREHLPCATLHTVTLLLSQISMSRKFHTLRKH